MKISTLLLALFCLPCAALQAQYVYGDDELPTAIQPLSEQLDIGITNLKVLAEKGADFKLDSGTNINIPLNAFLDASGNVVTGAVDIEYREFTNPLDFLVSGIPMTIDVAGKTETFQSAGMIEFNASQNGAPLFPNPFTEPISVEMISNQLDDDYAMYALNEKSGEWQETGKDEIIWDSKSAEARINLVAEPIGKGPSDTQFTPAVFQKKFGELKPHMEEAVFNFNILKKDHKYYKVKSKRALQFTINAGGTTHYSAKNNRGSYAYSELNHFNKKTWIYDGDNRKDIKELMEKFDDASYDTTLVNFFVLDIEVKPNYDTDNYHFIFHCKNDNQYIVEAYPYDGSMSPSSGQKQNLRLFEKYTKSLAERQAAWIKVEQDFEADLSEYEDRRLAHLQNLMDLEFLAQLGSDQLENGATVRKFDVVLFGVSNIDRIMKQQSQNLLARFQDMNRKPLEYKKVSVLDYSNNALISYYPKEVIKFDENANNTLIVFFEDDQIGVVTEQQFKSQQKKSDPVFGLTLMPLEDIDHKKMFNAIASK